jgi:acyl-CoA thioesterase YciA
MASEAQMLEYVFPKDTNNHGTAFGGFILSLMDKVASMAAVRHAKRPVVTARMDAVEFHVPIRAGSAVALHSKVISVGRTSMKILVDVHIENLATGEQKLATSGTFVFVALGEDGKPTPVPPLEQPVPSPTLE